MAHIYIQEKLKGKYGQVVSFDSNNEATLINIPPDPATCPLLLVEAPDNASRVIVTNGLVTIESEPESVQYIPFNSIGLNTKDNKSFYVKTKNVHQIYLPYMGEWVVGATSGGVIVSKTIYVTSVSTWEISLSYFNAYINVQYPAGAKCFCTNGVTTYNAPNNEGEYTFTVNSPGDWQINSYIEGSSQASTTVTISEAGESVNINLSFISNVLNNNSWEMIRNVIKEGLASSYWGIGDTKEVNLNGTVSDREFNNNIYYAKIIGFDHNSLLETNFNSSVTFEISKSNVNNFTPGNNNGDNIAFVDSKYNTTSSTKAFNFNYSASTTGGWKLSKMRLINMEEFYNLLPSDLQDIISVINKYTYNISTSSIEDTQDKLFLLSEYEIFGNDDSNEKDYQQQYDYYKNSSTIERIRQQDNSIANSCIWYLRTLNSSAAMKVIDINGEISIQNANKSLGICPAFTIS